MNHRPTHREDVFMIANTLPKLKAEYGQHCFVLDDGCLKEVAQCFACKAQG